ncbi:MAG: hypothetical protein OEZ06_29875 [Myxococcales bacterium]|nr:hypothetical protein [Myxococcales bacterium]
MARLAAMVPPPWQNQVRYSGVLAPAAKWRSRIVATAPGAQPETPLADAWQHLGAVPPPAPATPTVPKGKGCRYWPWALLKQRAFGPQSASCPSCQGRLQLRALVHDAHSIHRLLTHLHLPTLVPKPAPARGPPYHRGPYHRIGPDSPQQTWDL